MTDRTLTNYMSLGYQESDDVFVDPYGGLAQSGVVTGSTAKDSAELTNENQNAEGENFVVKFVYDKPSSASLAAVFMVAVVSFELADGKYKWVLQRVIMSSNSGNTKIIFSGSGEFNHSIRMYGVETHELRELMNARLGDTRILEKAQFVGAASWGTFTVDHDTTTFEQGCSGSLVVTPPEPGCLLSYSAGGYAITEQNGVAGASFRSRISFYYKNSSGAWANATSSIDFGNFGMPTADTDFGARVPYSFNRHLGENQVNPDGDWELAPFIRIIDANTYVTLSSCDLRYEVFIP